MKFLQVFVLVYGVLLLGILIAPAIKKVRAYLWIAKRNREGWKHSSDPKGNAQNVNAKS